MESKLRIVETITASRLREATEREGSYSGSTAQGDRSVPTFLTLSEIRAGWERFKAAKEEFRQNSDE